MRFAVVAGLLAVVSLGCEKQDGSESVSPEAGADGAGEAKGEASESGIEDSAEPHAIAGSELPGELVAELRLQGDGADGRLLTLAPTTVATVACSDCGAPSYLRILAVRCVDTMHCEILSEQCEGSVAREAERYELEFRAVDGAPEGSEEACAAYTGSFELP